MDNLQNFHHLFSSLASTLIVANLYSRNNKSFNLIEKLYKVCTGHHRKTIARTFPNFSQSFRTVISVDWTLPIWV